MKNIIILTLLFTRPLFFIDIGIFQQSMFKLNPPSSLKQTIEEKDSQNVFIVGEISEKNHNYKVYGSGIFINENTILTAAHVLKPKNKDLKSLKIYNGRSQNIDVDNIYFYNDAFGGGDFDDLAIIKTKRSNPTYTYVTKYDDYGPVKIIGYPSDIKSEPYVVRGEPYISKGDIVKISNGMFITTNYTLQGMSGSGVLNSKNELIGIHVSSVKVKDITGEDKIFAASVKFNRKQLEWIDRVSKY